MIKRLLLIAALLIPTPALAQQVTTLGPSASSTPTPGNIVQRDANGNAFANSFVSSGQSIATAAGTTTLTAASPRYTVFTGSTTQTLVMPDATTLTPNNSSSFYVNNNSSGTVTINANGGGSIYSLPAGGYVQINLLTNSVAAGTWDAHPIAPATWCIGTAAPCNGARTNTALSTTPYINAGASSATAGGFYPQFGQAQSWTGDATTLDAQIGGTTELAIKTTGISIPSGNTYQVNGTALAATALSDGSALTSWSPTISFAGAAVGITYTTQTGHWEKVGGINYAWYDIVLSNKGSSTGNVRINLPFTCTNNGDNVTHSIVNFVANAASLTGAAYSDGMPNNSYATVRLQGTTGSTGVDNTFFTNTTEINGQIACY